ncbi:LIC_12616 family protein [Silvanigrella sp.]|jgi:hypothetical protein|uniref:phage neck terminator protein n=1 Tax=Silvanigrella sp. TaxID=2024976 RepID=UPI0037C6972C
MIVTNEIRKICKLVSEYLNLPVYIAEQDCETKKQNYITVYIIGISPIGRKKTEIIDNQLKYIQLLELEICFDCIGSDAAKNAIKISNMWPLEEIQNKLADIDISWKKNNQIKNTSYLFSESYLPRMTFESYFYFKNEEIETHENIEKVKLNYGTN